MLELNGGQQLTQLSKPARPQQAQENGGRVQEPDEQTPLFVSLLSCVLPAALLHRDKAKTEAALAEKPVPRVVAKSQQQAGKSEENEAQTKKTEQVQVPAARPHTVDRQAGISLKLTQDQWLPVPRVEPDKLVLPPDAKTQSQPLQATRSAIPLVIQAPSMSELLQGLSGRIRVMSRQGIQQARLQLEPPELGRLALQLETKSGHLKVQIVTERVQVQEQLQLWLEQLKDNLRLAGVEFDQVEVEVQTQGESKDADFSSWLQTPVTIEEEPDYLEEVAIERSFGYNTFEMQG